MWIITQNNKTIANKKVPAKGTEKYTHLEYSTKTCCTQVKKIRRGEKW